MKKQLILLCFLIFGTLVLRAQTKISTYQKAYLLNKEAAVKVAKEQQMKQKNINIEIFLAEYPVLEDMNDFNKRHKYSLINDQLIEAVVVPDHGKYILFLLKNNIKYKVKKKKQVTKVF